MKRINPALVQWRAALAIKAKTDRARRSEPRRRRQDVTALHASAGVRKTVRARRSGDQADPPPEAA